MLNKKIELIDVEWNCLKIPFILCWFIYIISILWNINEITVDKGFCSFINCNIYIFEESKIILTLLAAVAVILYLFEFRMIFTTFILFFISVLIFSLHESFGVSERTGIIGLIFFAQFVSYLYYNKSNDFEQLKVRRINFSVQVILAGYTLSAISKIKTSGLNWILDGKNIVLQVVKSNQMEYLDGIFSHTEIFTSRKINFTLENYWIIGLLLFISLIIEGFSFLSIINKKLQLTWGVLLLLMHIGIYIQLEVVIWTFLVPMILFMLNPLYLLFLAIKKVNLLYK
jgi:hypothetical protein